MIINLLAIILTSMTWMRAMVVAVSQAEEAPAVGRIAEEALEDRMIPAVLEVHIIREGADQAEEALEVLIIREGADRAEEAPAVHTMAAVVATPVIHITQGTVEEIPGEVVATPVADRAAEEGVPADQAVIAAPAAGLIAEAVRAGRIIPVVTQAAEEIQAAGAKRTAKKQTRKKIINRGKKRRKKRNG